MTDTPANWPLYHPDRTIGRMQPIIAWQHFRQLIADKEDTEQVFRIAEALQNKGYRAIFEDFIASPEGRFLLERNLDLPAYLDDHDTLHQLPEGSVGRAYVDFMEREGLTAAGLVAESHKFRPPSERYADQLEWYGNHIRDVHDLYHVLTGYGRDALGEQCVLAFSWSQDRDLSLLFIGWAGGLEVKRHVQGGVPIFGAIREAQRAGRVAGKLARQDVVTLLAEPLDAARERLGIGSPETYYQARSMMEQQGIDPREILAAA